MAFEHTLASVRLQETKDPSVYMALCMVQSLFRDIEDRAGEYLCDCDLGSEKAAVKLLWLCEQIQDIYRHKIKDLSWDEEMEETMEDLVKTEEKLRSVENTVKELTAKRQEAADLQTRLKELQEAYGEYQALESACCQLEQEIAQCRKVNAEELEAMKQSVETLKQEREWLRTECESFRTEHLEPLGAEVEALQQKLADANEGKTKLAEKKQNLEGEFASAQGALQSLSAEVDSLTKEKEQLEIHTRNLQADKDSLVEQYRELSTLAYGLKDKNTKIRKEELEPLAETVQSLETEKHELQRNLNELTARREQLETEKNSLPGEIDAVEDRCAYLQKEIRELEDRYAVASEGLRNLDALQKDQMAAYTAQREKETALEEECEIYRKQYLEPVEKRIASLEDEKKRKNEILKGKQDYETNLGERIRGIVEDIEKANAAIYKYEKEIPQQQSALKSTGEDMEAKEAVLLNLRTEYEELEAKLQETKNQIDDLEYTLIPKCRADLLEDEGQFAQLSVQAEALTKELMQKRARTKEKEDLRNRLQEEYNELEEKCQRADAEIGRLTLLRDDLQSKTSEEQVEECKAKLREHTDRLAALLQLTEKLQAEIDSKNTECAAAEAQCNELTIRHAEWVKVEADLKKKKAELQLYGTESFLNQYRGKKQQLDRLEAACVGLRDAKNLLDSYLGVREQTAPSPDNLNAQIHRLKVAVDQIGAALVNMADSLKWEGKNG